MPAITQHHSTRQQTAALRQTGMYTVRRAHGRHSRTHIVEPLDGAVWVVTANHVSIRRLEGRTALQASVSESMRFQHSTCTCHHVCTGQMKSARVEQSIHILSKLDFANSMHLAAVAVRRLAVGGLWDVRAGVLWVERRLVICTGSHTGLETGAGPALLCFQVRAARGGCRQAGSCPAVVDAA